MSLDSVKNGIVGILSSAEGLLGNPTATAIGGAVIGSAVTGAVIAGSSALTKKRRKTSSKASKASRKRSRTRRRSPSYARTAGKRRDTSTRRIRMTKNGQPYVILKSGKARFISKKSASASRKRKGGRY